MNGKKKQAAKLQGLLQGMGGSSKQDPEPEAKQDPAPAASRKAEASPAIGSTRGDREPGKRARGYVQINVLVPSEIRAGVQLALNFDPERRDLSQLVADLLANWIEQQPEVVQKAIKAIPPPNTSTE